MFLKANLISFVAPKLLVLPMKLVYSVKACPFTSIQPTVLVYREPTIVYVCSCDGLESPLWLKSPQKEV